MAKIIAVTGGIGSGKSVVCNILKSLGYKVYDSDQRAKDIVDNDVRIKRNIAYDISNEVLDENLNLNRRILGQIVFNDKRKLEILNNIVHGAVKLDLRRWITTNASQPFLFLETAILYQSNVDKIVDEVWEVTAPEDIRIERVCLRNGFSPEEVKARINSQKFEVETPHPKTYEIINDGCASLLRQIDNLLNMPR